MLQLVLDIIFLFIVFCQFIC